MNNIEILNIPLLEWIGYVASVLVLISLSLSSILRLRVFNLIGAAVFSFYGFAIGALPVGIMNFIIVLTNLYYLRKLYFKKDQFEIIEATSDDIYVQKFLSYYRKDIKNFAPNFDQEQLSNKEITLVLRNMNLAGLLISQQKKDHVFIELDYVTPQYRDYKNGQFIYDNFKEALSVKTNTLMAQTDVPKQISYLKKMGFESSNTKDHTFILNLK